MTSATKAVASLRKEKGSQLANGIPGLNGMNATQKTQNRIGYSNGKQTKVVAISIFEVSRVEKANVLDDDMPNMAIRYRLQNVSHDSNVSER
jgi:hypothetical protein